MNYVHTFDTLSEQISTPFVKPWLSYVKDNEKTYYNKDREKEVVLDYNTPIENGSVEFHVEIISDGFSISGQYLSDHSTHLFMISTGYSESTGAYVASADPDIIIENVVKTHEKVQSFDFTITGEYFYLSSEMTFGGLITYKSWSTTHE